MRRLFAAFIPVLLAGCVAQYDVIPYFGQAVQTGQGGSKITRDGIDFWISGTPPRPYQIIGTMRDDRNTYHDRSPGNSRSIASIKRAGGTAAIVLSESDSKRPGLVVPTNGYGVMLPVKDSVTDLQIIKYLDTQ